MFRKNKKPPQLEIGIEQASFAIDGHPHPIRELQCQVSKINFRNGCRPADSHHAASDKKSREYNVSISALNMMAFLTIN
jgi:hypothetical protein